MKRKCILITGGSGILGMNWGCIKRDEWDVILGIHLNSVSLANVSTAHINLENIENLCKDVDDLRPDLIIHAAALTDVDQCEMNYDLASYVNGDLAGNIAKVAAKKNIPLIYISTDQLFAGDKNFYGEYERLAPLNNYGKSKALGELNVLSANKNALIVRTNFFGWGSIRRLSFTDWIIMGLRSGKELTMFEDVFFTPIYVNDLVECCHALYSKNISGIINLVGSQRISKYEFALAVCREFNLPNRLIKRGSVLDCNLKAKRPADMSLDNSKAIGLLDFFPDKIETYLKQLHMDEKNGRRAELLSAIR